MPHWAPTLQQVQCAVGVLMQQVLHPLFPLLQYNTWTMDYQYYDPEAVAGEPSGGREAEQSAAAMPAPAPKTASSRCAVSGPATAALRRCTSAALHHSAAWLFVPRWFPALRCCWGGARQCPLIS